MPGQLYHYYFDDAEKPVTIEADTSSLARSILSSVLPSLPDYANRQLLGETTSSLVTGVSTMVRNRKILIWNGKAWKEKQTPAMGPRRFLWMNGEWKEIK
jgi:hypothetical protein